MTLKMVLFVRLTPMSLGPPTEEGTLVPFNENYLIGVQSVVIDPIDRLWILDMRSITTDCTPIR